MLDFLRFLLLASFVVNLETECMGNTTEPPTLNNHQNGSSEATWDFYMTSPLPLLQTSQTSGLVSQAQYDRFTDIMWRYLTPATCIAGIILDGFGIAVLVKMKMLNSYYCSLFALFVVDEVYLVTVLVSCLPKIIEIYDVYLTNYINAHTEMFFFHLTNLEYAVCAHVLTFMSLDRCIKVAFPLNISNKCSCNYHIPVLVVIIVLNIGVVIPAFFMHTAEHNFDDYHNKTMYKTVTTHWATNNVELRRNFGTILILVTNIIPFFTIVLCNAGMCFLLWRQMEKRKTLFGSSENSRQQSEQIRIMVMLVIMAFFLSLSLLSSALTVFIAIHNPKEYRYGGSSLMMSLVNDIGVYLQVVSTSNDFIIFICAVRQTRQILRNMVCLKGR